MKDSEIQRINYNQFIAKPNGLPEITETEMAQKEFITKTWLKGRTKSVWLPAKDLEMLVRKFATIDELAALEPNIYELYFTKEQSA